MVGYEIIWRAPWASTHGTWLHQFAVAARSFRPGLKLLFVTGYAESAAARGSFLDKGRAMTGKPFALRELVERIRKMLEDGEQAVRFGGFTAIP